MGVSLRRSGVGAWIRGAACVAAWVAICGAVAWLCGDWLDLSYKAARPIWWQIDWALLLAISGVVLLFGARYRGLVVALPVIGALLAFQVGGWLRPEEAVQVILASWLAIAAACCVGTMLWRWRPGPRWRTPSGKAIAGVVATIALAAMGAYLYSTTVLPVLHWRDDEWQRSSTVEERRESVYQAMGWRGVQYHDGALMLLHWGDKDAASLLIRGLRWQGPSKDELVCTSAHYYEALQNLTGEDFGYDAPAWERWWREEGYHRPAETFYPRDDGRREPTSQPTTMEVVHEDE